MSTKPVAAHYSHFESKDALFEDGARRPARDGLRRLRDVRRKLAGDPQEIVSSSFKELMKWSGKPRFPGSGLTRLAMEPADLPGHPARRIASRHKQMLEDHLADLLADAGAAEPCGWATLEIDPADLAVAATQRDDAAHRMLDAMRKFGLGDGGVAQIVGTIALPVSEAVLVQRRGEHSRAVDRLKPILDEMYRLGGSHAQQDVLEQVFLDSASKADRGDDVRLALAQLELSPTAIAARFGHEVIE